MASTQLVSFDSAIYTHSLTNADRIPWHKIMLYPYTFLVKGLEQAQPIKIRGRGRGQNFYVENNGCRCE